MRRSIPAALKAVALAAALAGPGVAQEVGSPDRGHAVARRLCAECHAVEAARAASPRLDATPFAAIANTSGMTAMALSAALQTSHRTMPNVILEPTDFSDVVAYILSLKR